MRPIAAIERQSRQRPKIGVAQSSTLHVALESANNAILLAARWTTPLALPGNLPPICGGKAVHSRRNHAEIGGSRVLVTFICQTCTEGIVAFVLGRLLLAVVIAVVMV